MAMWEQRRSRAHPRLRGEHRPAIRPQKFRRGSSPLTRGARLTVNGKTSPSRLIPAYAGSTPPGTCKSDRVTAHPRLRGEHSSRLQVYQDSVGSSPLTRGAPWPASWWCGAGGLIPAYAGSTTVSVFVLVAGWAHPRLRGEHSSCSFVHSRIDGSSPLTRGARILYMVNSLTLRLIPAYAGSTPAYRY